jgi:hypothetical protein
MDDPTCGSKIGNNACPGFLKIMRNLLFSFLVLLAITPYAFPQCPNSGRTTFHKADKGFIGARHLGPWSYSSFFAGEEFKKGDDSPKISFWIDGALLQWLLVPFETFGSKKGADPKQQLEAHFKFETNYLSDMAKQGPVVVQDFAAYDPMEETGPDGKTHLFRIWRATLGKKGEAAPQYWVTTPHDQGIVELSIIQGKYADEAKIKMLIDNYMADFGAVSAASCKTLKQEFPDSPDPKGPNQ